MTVLINRFVVHAGVAMVLALSFCMLSCQKDDRTPDVRRSSGMVVDVALKLAVDESSMPLIEPMDPTPAAVAATRAVTPTNGEKIINDLNFFFVRKGLNTPVRHLYLTADDLAVNPGDDLKDIILKDMYIGRYEMYVVANQGEIEPAKATGFTAEEVDTLHIHNKFEKSVDFLAAGLPMTCKKPIEIKLVDGEPTPITVELEFAVSKINFLCTKGDAIKDKAKFKCVQVVNSVTSTRAFGGDGVTGNTYGNYSKEAAGMEALLFLDRTYYVLNNRCGVKPEIIMEQDRTIGRAPSQATYVYVETECNTDYNITQLFGFYVYAGGNDTDNFDVNSNTQYNVNVMLHSLEPDTDSRISSLKVAYNQWQLPNGVNVRNYTTLTITCRNLNGQSLRLTSGTSNGQLPDEVKKGAYTIELEDLDGGHSYGVATEPDYLSIKNLIVVPLDRYQFEVQFKYFFTALKMPDGNDYNYVLYVNIENSNGVNATQLLKIDYL